MNWDRRTTLRRFLAGLAGVALVLGGWWAVTGLFALEQQLAQSRAHEESMAAEIESLQATIAALRANPGPGASPELLRLRGEVADLKRVLALRSTNPVVAVPASASNQVGKDTSPAAGDPIPVSSLAFEGYLTPEASVRSLVWSLANGNIEGYLASLTPEGRAQAEQQFVGKSREETSEAMRREVAMVQGIRLDQIETTSDSSFFFKLTSTETDNGLTKVRDTAVLKFEKIDGVWKFTSP